VQKVQLMGILQYSKNNYSKKFQCGSKKAWQKYRQGKDEFSKTNSVVGHMFQQGISV
jgi:hypothetical protein